MDGTGPSGVPILTLEPFIEAVRDGVEARGWLLSGLQKTTSHEFEGRWAGEDTRSAYLFFHRGDLPETVSVDVFLDETSRGLRGNLALAVGGPVLGSFSEVQSVLGRLGRSARAVLPEGYRAPVTFRAHLADGHHEPAGAEVEVRFKLQVPSAALEAGASAVSALSGATVDAFDALLRSRVVSDLLFEGSEPLEGSTSAE